MKTKAAPPEHARFGISSFTYPARNTAFLSLVGKHWIAPTRESIVLMGSGPIEPFEVLSIPYYSNARVTAFDSNPEVVEIVRKALKNRRVEVANLTQVCRSEDSENPYFQNRELMNRQLQKANLKSYRVYAGDVVQWDAFFVDKKWHKQIKIRLCDLLTNIPIEVSDASLVFEGYMLINWEKTPRLFSCSQMFLEQLFKRMRPEAWFASTTSVTHYLGEFSKPFLSQVIAAGRIPAAGVLARWAVGRDGRVTSQFGTVFKSPSIKDEHLLQVGHTLEDCSIRSLSSFNIQIHTEAMNLECLSDALSHGDILSFRQTQEGVFRVNRISWNDLTRKSAVLNTAYELEFCP